MKPWTTAVRPFAFSLAALMAAGCAMTPQTNNSLESARSTYRLAQADPQVQLRAPVELQLAERSLAQAERSWKDGAEPAIVGHHANLAEQRARIAMKMADLKAQQTERGWVVTLRSELLFDSGRASLKPGAEKALENLAQLMKRQPEREITIEGFTDSTGSEELNRRLSEQRAQAVKQALVARGIEAHRIDARGYGPAFPVASNDTPTGRQLNRRVEVVIAPEPRTSSAGGATGR